MAFIIHGATGAQGAPLLQRLVRAGLPAVAAVRNPAAVPQQPVRIPAVAIDNASVESLVAAYRGADGVFVHLPLAAEEQRMHYARNIAQACARARPRRVVISTSGGVVDAPGSPLQLPAASAVATLMREVEASGVSCAVVAPRLFLENLLLPVVWEPLQAEGVLRYPLRAHYPVSWCSHLDVAEVAERLLLDATVTGVVGVGHLPGLSADGLAAEMASSLGRSVVFDSVTPAAFGEMVRPLIGAPAAAAVVALYAALAQAPDHVIAAASSAQRLLGVQPRTVQQWLREIGA